MYMRICKHVRRLAGAGGGRVRRRRLEVAEGVSPGYKLQLRLPATTLAPLCWLGPPSSQTLLGRCIRSRRWLLDFGPSSAGDALGPVAQ